jgi:succinate dehydrogenase flavin-adding protein (antitoxin of CptAB toxin-antitoxin module)
MTKLLDLAIEYAKELPAEMQDEIAGTLLRLMGQDDGEVYQLTTEEDADLDEADREIERGEVVSEDEVRAILAKYMR